MTISGDSPTVNHEAGGRPDERSRLLDVAVDRLVSCRRTFTEAEALGAVWEAGYEVSPQSDPRFCLAREADGKHPRHWRLVQHTLANERLLGALNVGDWDGREVDRELARMDASDGGHHVFCSVDPRFERRADGTLEPADRERPVLIPDATRAELDGLSSTLLERWQAADAEPRTVRQVTESLGELGWKAAPDRESWLQVRAWLLERSDFVRVGQDYWMPAGGIPPTPKRQRLQVLPVHGPGVTVLAPEGGEAAVAGATPQVVEVSPPAELVPVQAGEPTTRTANWVVPLRTLQLVEGFIPVPKDARAIYPARAPGEAETTVLRGMWFSTGDRLWLWLDRTCDRLYGPALAEQLAWCEAGDLLRVEWSGDGVVLRVAGHDSAVQEEETRLVDPEALAALRGGLGESYRRSLQAILAAEPNGLRFPEVVVALRERQGHAVHGGTVRALLHAGGFVQRDGRWLAAPSAEVAARSLRAATVATLARVPDANGSSTQDAAPLRTLASAIRDRLTELVAGLQRRKDRI
jgi:hypothetical protein